MPHQPKGTWERVDWSLPNKRIATQLGVGVSTVFYQRTQRAPQTLGRPHGIRRQSVIAALHKELQNCPRCSALLAAIDALQAGSKFANTNTEEAP